MYGSIRLAGLIRNLRRFGAAARNCLRLRMTFTALTVFIVCRRWRHVRQSRACRCDAARLQSGVHSARPPSSRSADAPRPTGGRSSSFAPPKPTARSEPAFPGARGPIPAPPALGVPDTQFELAFFASSLHDRPLAVGSTPDHQRWALSAQRRHQLSVGSRHRGSDSVLACCISGSRCTHSMGACTDACSHQTAIAII